MKASLDYLAMSRDTVLAAIDDLDFASAIHDIVAVTANAVSAARKLFLAGNGCSAADAQHLAAEMLSRLNFLRLHSRAHNQLWVA
jgi:D-sedoheptulose 7-phosphate isomerase